MEKSKDLFMQLREQEIANPHPSKKELILEAEKFTEKILDAGQVTKQELLCQVVRHAQVFNTMLEKLKSEIDEDFSMFGIKVQKRNGRENLNYFEDEVWKDLNLKIKEREADLKTSYKSKGVVYDLDGCEIPKVGTTPTKDSLTLTF